MDLTLEEAQDLRIAVEGCVSHTRLFESISLIIVFRVMVLWMQYMPQWIKPVKFEVGMGSICSSLEVTFK